MGLDHDGRVGATSGAGMTASHQSLDHASELVARCERRRPGVVRLATAVSLAVRVEPGLLRRARRELSPGVSIADELELWFSPLVASSTARGLVLDADVAAVLRMRLRDDDRALAAARELVVQLHEEAAPTLRLEEEMVFAVLTGRDDEVAGMLEAVLEKIAQEPDRGRGIARWAQRALAEMPREIREGAAARELLARSKSLLQTPVAVGIALTRREIQVSEPPGEHAHVMDLPPDELWLDVREPGARPAERIVVQRGATASHEIEGSGTFELRTADGQVGRIRPRSSARRNTSRDGLRNRLQFYMLDHFEPLWRVMQRISTLERSVNRSLVNQVITSAPPPVPIDPSAEALTERSGGWLLPPSAAGDASLPDVERVGALFRREVEMRPCTKSTVLFAWFAQWFNEPFVRTVQRHPSASHADITRLESDQRPDLSQLYGLHRDHTASLRAGRGGLLKSSVIGGEEFPERLCDESGSLKREFAALEVAGFHQLTRDQRSDLFAVGDPSANVHVGSMAMTVLFLREHNRIARELASHYPDWDDERLFRTARNILTVIELKLLVEEYVNHLSSHVFRYRFLPNSFVTARWQSSSWIAVDVNVAYRWHSLVPSVLRLGGDELPVERTLFANRLLTRHGLGRLFDDASAQRAGEVGLFNTSEWLVPRVELSTLREARAARLATYNDYRVHHGLPRVTRVEQISSSPAVRNALDDLYPDVDSIELYIGLLAEDTIPNAVLPPLMGRMVGGHMLARIFGHPLLRPGVFTEQTFSPMGWETIHADVTLEDLLQRNSPPGSPHYAARFTWEGWKRH
jgi:prostaglandin-endoperoxide synthase 2